MWFLLFIYFDDIDKNPMKLSFRAVPPEGISAPETSPRVSAPLTHRYPALILEVILSPTQPDPPSPAVLPTLIEPLPYFGGIVGKIGKDHLTVLFPKAEKMEWKTLLHNGLQSIRYLQKQTHPGAWQFNATLRPGHISISNFGPDFPANYLLTEPSPDIQHYQPLTESIALDHTLNRYCPVTELKRVLSMEITLPEVPSVPFNTFKNWRPPLSGTPVIRPAATPVLLHAIFTGLDFLHDPDVYDKLHHYTTTMLAFIRKYNGELMHLDAGTQGLQLQIMFEADRQRGAFPALACSLEMQHAAGTLPFTGLQRIAIHTGTVEIQQFDSAGYSQVVLLGDTVEILQQLVEKVPPGQVVITSAAAQKNHHQFVWQAIQLPPPLPREVPYALYQLEGRKLPTPRKSHRFIGRTHQLNQMEQIYRHTRHHGQLIAITGHPGVGKSRLVQEWVNHTPATSAYFTHSGECTPLHLNRPYQVWSDLLSSFFHLETASNAERNSARVHQYMQRVCPECLALTPLWNDILHLNIPETPESTALTPALRQQSLFYLIQELFRRECRYKPLVLVLENLHWIDPLSLELLNHLAQALETIPLLIVITCHPPTPSTEDPLNGLRELPYYHDLPLEPLSNVEINQLIETQLSIKPLPVTLIERIRRKSRGNLFFIKEFVLELQDQGILVTGDLETNSQLTVPPASIKLPENVNELLQQRIQRLDEQSKLILEVASVIGESFTMDQLTNIYPIAIDSQQLTETVQHLSKTYLKRVTVSAAEQWYLFKHLLVQEAAYKNLRFAHRQQLHEKVAMYLEKTYAHTLEPFIYHLAYHYSFTTNVQKQRFYYEKAAELARAQYDNSLAIYFYSKAIDLQATLGKDSVWERVHLIYRRAEVLELVGNYRHALSDYEQIEHLCEQERRIPLKISALKGQGKIHSIMGQQERARNLWENALQLAQETGELAQEAALLNNIGVSYLLEGDLEQAMTRYHHALRLHEHTDDAEGRADTLRNIGIVHYYQEAFDSALTYYQQAAELYHICGNRAKACETLSNLVWIYFDRHQIENALATATETLHLAQSIGYVKEEGLAYQKLGRIYFAQGNYEEAITAYQKSLQIATYATHNPEDRKDALFALGWMYQVVNNYELSLVYYTEALHEITILQNPEQEAYLLRWKGLVHQKAGQFEDALQCYQHALELAEAHGFMAERTKTLNFIGLWYQTQNQLEKALDYHQHAVDNIDHVTFHAESAEECTHIYLAWGNCLRGLHQYESARQAYENALEKMPTGDPDIQWQTYLGYARVLSDLQEWDAAQTAYEQGLEQIETIYHQLHQYAYPFIMDKVIYYQEYIALLNRNHLTDKARQWQHQIETYLKPAEDTA